MARSRREHQALRDGLGSRVGRRIFALFVGCSLVPLALFAWFALSEVTAELRDESDRQMRHLTKSTGVTLVERLLILRTDLDYAAAELARFGVEAGEESPAELRSRLAERFETLFLQRGARRFAMHGEPIALPELTPGEREHLDADQALLVSIPQPGRRARVAMLRRTQVRGSEGGLLAGVIRPQELWELEGVRPTIGELLVRDVHGNVLFESTEGLFPLPQLDRALAQEASNGTVRWEEPAGTMIARYWRMFVRPRFHMDWIVVHARQESFALATLQSFRWLFTLTAILTSLCVTALSLTLIRRTLGPIRELRQATRRVAGGDLSTRVEIHTRDEFGELGDSFNHMTEELQEHKRELVQARDEALAAARVEAELVSNVSHELRTPLTSILSFGEILQQYGEEDPHTREEFLGIIIDQARHLTKIVDQMLQLSRLQNGEAEWRLDDVDVGRWIQQTIHDLPAERRRRLVLELAPELPRVRGDSAHLTHVWYHLIDNALKFSPADALVHVRAWTQDEHLIVEVQDQGIGIEPENQSVIFERFRQVDRDYLTDKAAGTGLGLALVRDVVLRHRGQIEVESVRGQGATFRVRLPLAAEPVGV